MSWARRHPILLGAILLPILLVAGLWTDDSLQRRAFYEKHRLVKEIDEHPHGLQSEVISKYLPLGTHRSEAIQVMSQEGFSCRPWTDRYGQNRVGCSLLQEPAGFGRTGRRLIQLSFNQDETLTNATEIPLK
jgi:hypothetical protein